MVQQQLDPVDDLRGRPRGRPVDQVGGTAGRRQRRYVVDRLARRTTVAERERHLPREHHEPVVAGHQEPPRQQLLGGRARLLRGHVAAGGAGRGLPAVGVDVVEHPAGRLAQPGDLVGDPVGREGWLGPRPDAAGPR